MPLNANAVMTFASYEVQDTGISFHFSCANPGGGMPSDWYVFTTDAELAAVSTQGQLQTLLQTKLNRKLRASGIATKLDGFIGQSLTV